ncbi:hypothetical protein BDW60DRAFT_195540 [Aspergillus nidulans var. acristatus]
MSLRGIALSPDYFHRAYDFCPERFLANPPAEFKNEDHKPYHPFSVGACNVSLYITGILSSAGPYH